MSFVVRCPSEYKAIRQTLKVDRWDILSFQQKRFACQNLPYSTLALIISIWPLWKVDAYFAIFPLFCVLFRIYCTRLNLFGGRNLMQEHMLSSELLDQIFPTVKPVGQIAIDVYHRRLHNRLHLN